MAKNRLTEIVVEEVSLVDRGANGKRFALVKSSSVVKVVDVQGIQVNIDRPKGYVQEGKDADGVVWKREYKNDYGYISDTNGGDDEPLDCYIGDTLDSPYALIIYQVKKTGEFDEYKVMLGFDSGNACVECYAAHTPMEYFGDAFVCDVNFIKSLLNVVKKSDKRISLRSALDSTVKKELWSTAYVNDLPDSAFLYIAGGGEKDETGKTKPRTLRYFPVYDSNGKLDLPHLRNALARIPQANIPQTEKDKAKVKAEHLLEGEKKASAPSTKSSGVMITPDDKNRLMAILSDCMARMSVISEMINDMPVDSTAEAGVPEEVCTRLTEVSTKLSSVCASPDTTTKVEKIGRKISQTRYDKIKSAHALLTDVLSETSYDVDEEKVALKEKCAALEKALKDSQAVVSKTSGAIASLQKSVELLNRDVVAVRNTRTVGNSARAGGAKPSVVNKDIAWPSDLSPNENKKE